jgi:hypothetical protein
MNTLGTNARCVALLLALLLLSGCNAVLVKEPMGDTVVTLDPATWQGTWASSEVVILTTVLDSEKGLLQAAWVERGAEGEGASFESVSGMVRQTGDVIFLSMENEPEEPLDPTAALAADAPAEQTPATPAPPAAAARPPEYIWGRIDNDGKRIILWWPNVEQFQRAVQDGRLPGTVTESEDVVLEPLDPAQLELINSPAGNLLGWAEPAVFVRIGD